jgi:hypothetical protein
MKTLKYYYKETIKSLANEIKTSKADTKVAQRAGESRASGMQSDMVSQRRRARYLYLAYASIRGRDLSTVERNPRKEHDKVLLDQTIAQVKKAFDDIQDAAKVKTSE